MPTRISVGVGDHLCFLTFYLYDPYRLQNHKFSRIFVCLLFKDYHNYLLVHALLLISGKPVSQYVHILSLSAHCTVL